MVISVIQARMGSSRLPGKVMKEAAGIPLIGHLLNRLKKSELIDAIVIATSDNPENEPMISYLESNGYKVFKGSEEDVLDRFYQALKDKKSDTVVRITGDCPLIDYKTVDLVISEFKKRKLDYLGCGKSFPEGYGSEVFTFKGLEQAWQRAALKSEREHVTPYIWKHPEIFKVQKLEMANDYSHIRVTVDEPEDFTAVKAIFENFYPEKGEDFFLEDIVDYLENHKDIYDMNKHIIRNEGYIKSLKEDKNVR